MKVKQKRLQNLQSLGLFGGKAAGPVLHALEDVLEHWLVLLEDHRGDVEVALQLVQLAAHLRRQLRHGHPVLHLVEEARQTE